LTISGHSTGLLSNPRAQMRIPVLLPNAGKGELQVWIREMIPVILRNIGARIR